jgi:hypothetical protein
LNFQATVLFRVRLVDLDSSGVWDFSWDFLAAVSSAEELHPRYRVPTRPVTSILEFDGVVRRA